jgi:hypothetical protein
MPAKRRGDRAARPAPAHSATPHQRNPNARRGSRTADPVEPLIVDLVAWIATDARPDADAIEAWRTSCPRLPVQKEANPHGDSSIGATSLDGVRWWCCPSRVARISASAARRETR